MWRKTTRFAHIGGSPKFHTVYSFEWKKLYFPHHRSNTINSVVSITYQTEDNSLTLNLSEIYIGFCHEFLHDISFGIPRRLPKNMNCNDRPTAT
jgi:hypothetical protein